MIIVVAGATGAIGKPLIPQLVERGHEVYGMTKSFDKVEPLQHQGARAVLVDVFDSAAVHEKLASIKPEAVFHFLTDLPFGTPADLMKEGSKRNARMRREGTRNLVDASLACGARRIIATSIAWIYGPDGAPHSEEDPIDVRDAAPGKATNEAVAELEERVLHSPPLSGVVLRNGLLYGPGTGHEMRNGAVSVHVEAAVQAAMLAFERNADGIFNIVDDNDQVSNAKARSILGWVPNFQPSQ